MQTENFSAKSCIETEIQRIKVIKMVFKSIFSWKQGQSYHEGYRLMEKKCPFIACIVC